MKKKIMKIGIIVLILGLTFIFIKIRINSKQELSINNTETNENKAEFEVTDIIASAEEEITINIKMLEDSEFVAGNFELLYDKEKMEYIKHEEGEILEAGAMSIVNNDKENNKLLIAYVGNPQNGTNSIEKGNLINITFKLKESINNEEIVPEFKATTLKNKEGNDVECIVNQATITVKERK